MKEGKKGWGSGEKIRGGEGQEGGEGSKTIICVLYIKPWLQEHLLCHRTE